MKNTLLNIALILCKIIRLGLVMGFIGLTTFFIHLQIDKSYYEGRELKFDIKNYNFSTSMKWKIDNAMEDEDVYTIDNIKLSSLYFNYMKFIIVLTFVFIAVKEFQKIIESVKRVETFGVENVKSFRRIGVIVLIYVVLMSYSSIIFNQGGFRGFGFSIYPLILALLAFIMAEIFKEGAFLKQENDLTI
jgi:hypothetical protein